MELVCGKYYDLLIKFDKDFQLPEDEADRLSGIYKLIGQGTILYGNNNKCEFVYYIFKDNNNQMLEVFKNGKYKSGKTKFGTLIFIDTDETVMTGNYTDYLDHGDEKMKTFGGGDDFCVDVKINIFNYLNKLV